MKKAIALVILAAVCLTVYAQNNPPSNKTAPEVMVRLKPGGAEAFRQITVNDSNEIVLDEWPAQIVFAFPSSGFMNFSIRINKAGEKESFTVAFQCPDKNCEQVLLTDIEQGKLLLAFSKGQLTGIGQRLITGRNVTGKKPYLKITGAEAQQEKKPAQLSKQQVLFIDAALIKEQLKCFSCDTLLKDCQACKDTLQPAHQRAAFPFRQELEKSVSNGILGNAATYRYRIVYDQFADTLYYLKLKRKWFKNYEYYKAKKIISPGAKREILLQIIGQKDSVYNISMDTANFFLEGKNAFQQMVNDAAADATVRAVDSALPKVNTQFNINNIYAETKMIAPHSYSPCDSLLAHLVNNKLLSMTAENAGFMTKQKGKPKAFFCQLLLQYDSLLRHNAALTDSIRSLRALIEQLPDAIQLKATLLALDMALEMFNYRFRSIIFREEEYRKALACLMLRMKNCLQIPVTANSKALSASLSLMVQSSVPDAYSTEFKNLIAAIESEYQRALRAGDTQAVISKSIKVPDADQFTISIGAGKDKQQIFKRDFDISGGFKIDFATGIFFTGLGSREYLIAPSNFKYVVDTAGGLNNVRDTSGNLIRENYSSLTYGVGLFSHGYIRTGTFFNAGLSTGLMITNTGNIQVLAGGSILLNSAGNNRFAIVGGIAFGKQKVLSASAAESKQSPYQEFENGRRVFQTASQLPRFYSSPNTSEVPTYERWNSSYFFGLTYNFSK